MKIIFKPTAPLTFADIQPGEPFYHDDPYLLASDRKEQRLKIALPWGGTAAYKLGGSGKAYRVADDRPVRRDGEATSVTAPWRSGRNVAIKPGEVWEFRHSDVLWLALPGGNLASLNDGSIMTFDKFDDMDVRLVEGYFVHQTTTP